MKMNEVIFRDIRLGYVTFSGIVEILRGINLALSSGDIVGIVGESGAGKSLFMKSLCALANRPEASYLLDRRFILNGRMIVKKSTPVLAMIPQNSKGCLNPSLRVGQHLREILRVAQQNSDNRDSPERLLSMVDLPNNRGFQRNYPHELSGGMQQRLAIACVLAANVDIIIADEVTTALDNETAQQILNIFTMLAHELNKTVLMVGHNLRMFRGFVDRVLVMYRGHVIEEGYADLFFQHPIHPYSHALIKSLPSSQNRSEPLWEIQGDISPPEERLSGCPFAPRCFQRQDDCFKILPAMTGKTDRRYRCIHPMNSFLGMITDVKSTGEKLTKESEET